MKILTSTVPEYLIGDCRIGTDLYKTNNEKYWLNIQNLKSNNISTKLLNEANPKYEIVKSHSCMEDSDSILVDKFPVT